MAKRRTQWKKNPASEANRTTYDDATKTYDDPTLTYDSIVVGEPKDTKKKPKVWHKQ